MSYRQKSARQNAGEAQPVASNNDAVFSPNEVTFAMDWQGSSRQFVLPSETLAHLAGGNVKNMPVAAIFEAHRKHIMGVASRSLRAGATGEVIALRPSQFV